jgi:hypothetical protein
MSDDVADTARAEGRVHRAVLSHVLGAVPSGLCARAEIESRLSPIPAWSVNDAIDDLADDGLVEVLGEQLRATARARGRGDASWSPAA